MTAKERRKRNRATYKENLLKLVEQNDCFMIVNRKEYKTRNDLNRDLRYSQVDSGVIGLYIFCPIKNLYQFTKDLNKIKGIKRSLTREEEVLKEYIRTGGNVWKINNQLGIDKKEIENILYSNYLSY